MNNNDTLLKRQLKNDILLYVLEELSIIKEDKMNFEKVKSELLKIDSRFRIERPDKDTIHICYGTKIFVCAIQNKNGKWGFSIDYNDFKECRDFRDALNKVDDWWDCTKASVTAPKLTDEEFRRQAFTNDPDVIAKRLADYTSYWF